MWKSTRPKDSKPGRRGCLVHEPPAKGLRHRFGSVVYAELAEDLLEVGLDRFLGDVDVLGNFSSRFAVRKLLKNRELPVGQSRGILSTDASEDPFGNIGIQHRPAFGDVPDRLHNGF